jgi:alkaline phosphatase D
MTGAPLDRRQFLKFSAYSSLLGGLGACAQISTVTAVENSNGLPAWPSDVQKIIFGSCIDQKKPQPIWQTILAAKPDLFIFGGDNVYASSQPWQLQNLKNAYATQAAQAGFAALRASVPHMAIWDDHDMGLNDGGVEFPHKQAAKNEFIDFWRLPVDDPRRMREGL